MRTTTHDATTNAMASTGRGFAGEARGDVWGALLLVVRRSLSQHAFSTIITALSVALACGLVMAVFQIRRQTYEAFTGGAIGYDAVLGARGSPLQLVLNTVFHLETSPGNIPYSMYEAIKRDPRVALAIPYAVGDNFRGFRIVGTTGEIFTQFEYQRGRKFQFEAGGRAFNPEAREAVIGSTVAARTGLRAGSRFNPYHGLVFDERARHAEEYTIVGVLQPTNTSADRVIWIPIEGIYRMSGHVLRGAGETYRPQADEEIPDEHREVSAVMIRLRSPQAGFELDQTINRQGRAATFAFPISRVMVELFERIGWVNRILTLVAYLVVVVAAGSILASIYNTISERRREFAILRALGARRRLVFSTVVAEAAAIAFLGSIAGYLVYAAILAAAYFVVREQTGVVLDVLDVNALLIVTPVLMTLIGAAAGLIPAFKAYRTDVAENLAPIS